jgi:hypothetical protein
VGWRRYFSILVFLLVASTAVAADPPLVDGISGAPIGWTDWIGKRGPVALLFWASWAPDAKTVIERHGDISKACQAANLTLVVVGVQESLEAGRASLGGERISWIHDRHGALLKRFRVIQVPSLAVVSAEGKALARLAPTAEALEGWGRQ